MEQNTRSIKTSCARVLQQSIATQNSPFSFILTLSGNPGRFAIISLVPLFGPSSQYFISLHLHITNANLISSSITIFLRNKTCLFIKIVPAIGSFSIEEKRMVSRKLYSIRECQPIQHYMSCFCWRIDPKDDL